MCSGKTLTTSFLWKAQRNTHWRTRSWLSALCQKQTLGCITVQQLCWMWLTTGRRQSDREPLWKSQVRTSRRFNTTSDRHPLHVSWCSCLKKLGFISRDGLKPRSRIVGDFVCPADCVQPPCPGHHHLHKGTVTVLRTTFQSQAMLHFQDKRYKAVTGAVPWGTKAKRE